MDDRRILCKMDERRKGKEVDPEMNQRLGEEITRSSQREKENG